MPTKNFYTANGMIIGESSGGTSTVYAPDGQGNVAATYSAGVKQNSYLYAPYGTLIEKTGTAADPKFLWNGGSGYRNTGRSYADVYVRRRTYDTLSGQWASADPITPPSSLIPYCYANASPATRSDPSGLITWRTITGPWLQGTCGEYCLSAAGMLSAKEAVQRQNSPGGGAVVQHITGTLRISQCATGQTLQNSTLDYYEAWAVSQAGQVSSCAGAVPGVIDVWALRQALGRIGPGGCTYGSVDLTGTAGFVPTDIPFSTGYESFGFQCDASSPAGGLYYSANAPVGMILVLDSVRHISVQWSCCLPYIGLPHLVARICPDKAHGMQWVPSTAYWGNSISGGTTFMTGTCF